MLYQKAKVKNGQLVIAESKQIDQSKLTADCWLIQFNGLSACESCEFLNTAECGGQAIRKTPIAPPIPKVTVCNITGSSGREVVNQFEIRTDDATYFQSYRTIIACRTNGKVYLDADSWDYSTTTGRYRNIFLCETKRETQKKIDSGEYILTDLN